MSFLLIIVPDAYMSNVISIPLNKLIQGNLICLQRSSGDGEAVPGCSGGEADFSSTDYCYFPPAILDRIGNDGSPSRQFPLGKCQGDCDNDDECKV